MRKLELRQNLKPQGETMNVVRLHCVLMACQVSFVHSLQPSYPLPRVNLVILVFQSNPESLSLNVPA